MGYKAARKREELEREKDEKNRAEAEAKAMEEAKQSLKAKREEAQFVREPGKEFELTDAELLVAPVSILTPQQRKLRRTLQRNTDTRKRETQQRERRLGKTAKVKYCQGEKKNGEQCSSGAVAGARHCFWHLTDGEREKLNLPKPGGTGMRPSTRSKITKRSAPQLMREVVEQAVDKLVSRYFTALGLEFIGFDEEGNPVVEDRGVAEGIVLHGVSKDGTVHLSAHPDLMNQIAVMEKLLDRVYGKARQTQVIEGGTRPVKVAPVRTADRAQVVASLLQGTGALGGHDGRQRRQPSEAPAASSVPNTAGADSPPDTEVHIQKTSADASESSHGTGTPSADQ